MIGSLIAGKLSDIIGRSKTLFYDDLIYMVGTIFCSFAPNYWVLVVGRFITGLAVGIASTVVPLFIGEISPIEIRGKIGGFFLFFLFILLIYFIFIQSFKPIFCRFWSFISIFIKLFSCKC
jgi:MFS family permease